jgi:hypothetical protein
MNVEILDDLAALDPRQWDELLERSPTRTLFQTWAWQSAWWRACGKGRLFLAALFDGARLRAVLPLVLQEGVLRLTGHGAADRMDFIYDGHFSADLVELFLALQTRSDWREMDLGRIPEDSPTWKYLKALAADTGLYLLSSRKDPLLGLRLDGREERVERLLHGGVLARHAAAFAAKGNVRTVHHPSPELSEVPWKDMFIQHIHRWALRAAGGVFTARAARDLCRSYAEDPALRAGLVLSTVFLDDAPAAYHLGVIHDNVFHSLVSTFDIALRRFSPDDVLFREVTAHALERGCREIIYTMSDEPAVRGSAERVGRARSIRVFRSRGRQWQAKLKRWAGKAPLAGGIRDIALELSRTAAVLFGRSRALAAASSATGIKTMTVRPEVELIRRLRPELKGMRVIEMGIGNDSAGIFFAGAVKSYTGLDRDPAQAAAARARLDDQLSAEDILAADPSNITFARDGVYDLVLFSAGGIDVLSSAERARIFEEVRRVGREGALFFFSSRNLQSIMAARSYGPADLLRRWRRRMLLAAANRDLALLCHQPVALLCEEAGQGASRVCYIRPREQVRVLKEAGFHDIRVFSGRTGLEVRDWRRWDKLADDMLYYLCRV